MYAPWVNFTAAMMIVTMPVMIPPTPLMARPARHPGSRWTRWRFAIPSCENVNVVNTPIA